MKIIYLAYGLPGPAMASEIMREDGSILEDQTRDERIISAEACDSIDAVKLEIIDEADPGEIAEDYAGEWAWTIDALEQLLDNPRDFVSDEERY